MDPTHRIVCTRKNFIGYIDVMQGWFSAKVGSKISDGSSHNCKHNLCGHQQPWGHKRNRNQPLLLIHMDPSNTIVCTRKNFICYDGMMQGWFSAKVGSKISDGSHNCQNNFCVATNSHRDTKETGINHFYPSIWIQQTALYGQGKISLAILL
jgi:hypothetical protein